MRCSSIAVPGFVAFLLTGCAGLSSLPTPTDGDASLPDNTAKTNVSDPSDGLVYRLPRRSIVLTVTKASDTKSPDTVSLAPGDAEPDLSTRFLLRFPSNWLGSTHPDIVVTEKGLLSSATGDNKSGVDDVLTNLAKAAGMTSALLISAPVHREPTHEDCKPGREYAVVVDPDPTKAVEDSRCDYKISVAPRDLPHKVIYLKAHESDFSLSRELNEGGDAGVFYRQELPYKVTVTDPSGKAMTEKVMYSPNNAPALFVRVDRSFFGNSKTALTFKDGLLTGYEGTTDGEIVGAAKIPADVLSAYFTAIGTMFQSKANNTQYEKTLLQNQEDLAVQKIHLEACKAAVAAYKQGDDIAPVKAACGGS
jgi:hypothetical protein